MDGHRYRNALLTIIAVELGWIALTHTGVPVSAQAAATRVIITGVELPPNATVPVFMRGVDLADREAFLPVGVLGQIPAAGPRFRPIDIRAAQPIPIETNRPIEVRIPVTSSPRPGQ